MKIATCTLASAAPYSQSRAYDHEVPRLPRETPDAYETRTWRHRCHATSDGRIRIPPMSFKLALDDAARALGRQIPGRGKATYTKFFQAGVLVMEPLVLPIKVDEVPMDRIHCHVTGVPGSGKRVWKNFPRIDEWSGDVNFHVLADEITKDVFEEHLKQAGAFIGIGRFRPQNRGFYGRYEVKKIRWN